MDLRHLPRTTAAGMVGGVAATAVMSTAMLAAGRLGLMGEYPPERIAHKSLDKIVAGPGMAERFDGPIGAVLHVAFGAVTGAAFALATRVGDDRLRANLPKRARSRSVALPAAGIVFGTGVWLVSYWGWVPALGILPPPDQDRLDRQVSMLVAHWLYGASLGLMVDALRVTPEERARRR